MAVLNIHLEGVNPKSFSKGNVLTRLTELLSRKVPAVLSLPPWMEGYWRNENPAILELARAVVQRPGSFLGQQGNTHRCRYDHPVADPWHENHCFYNKPLNAEEQGELMFRGSETLETLMGVKPAVYVSPNHQFDQTTLEVAENHGYRYFADLALLPVRPYYFGKMLVVPEAPLKKGRFSFGNYIHYDEIDAHPKSYERAMIMATPLNELAGIDSPDCLWQVNRAVKTSLKVARDVKRFVAGRNGSH